jgi:hypothetical protein
MAKGLLVSFTHNPLKLGTRNRPDTSLLIVLHISSCPTRLTSAEKWGDLISTLGESIGYRHCLLYFFSVSAARYQDITWNYLTAFSTVHSKLLYSETCPKRSHKGPKFFKVHAVFFSQRYLKCRFLDLQTLGTLKFSAKGRATL